MRGFKRDVRGFKRGLRGMSGLIKFLQEYKRWRSRGFERDVRDVRGFESDVRGFGRDVGVCKVSQGV